jgi:hypothetical protein
MSYMGLVLISSRLDENLELFFRNVGLLPWLGEKAGYYDVESCAVQPDMVDAMFIRGTERKGFE